MMMCKKCMCYETFVHCTKKQEGVQDHPKQFPSNPDVAPHLKRLLLLLLIIIILVIFIFLVLDREWGNDPKDPIHILNLSS